MHKQLNDYVSKVLEATFKRRGGDEYYVPDDVYDELMADVEEKLKKLGHGKLIDAWKKCLSDMLASGMSSNIVQHVQEYIEKIVNSHVVSQYGRAMMITIINAPISDIVAHFGTYSAGVKTINLPGSLKPLIDLATSDVGGSRGSMIGKGEAVIPLLFLDGEWNYGNDAHDVTIGGTAWHVKGSATAPLGKQSYTNSPLGQQLRNMGMHGSELAIDSDDPKRSFIPMFPKIRRLEQFESIESDIAVVRAFQDQLDSEMREIGIGDANGVIFALGSKLIFVDKQECYCNGATQSAHKVTMEKDFFPRNFKNYMTKAVSNRMSEIAMLLKNKVDSDIDSYKSAIESGIKLSDMIYDHANENDVDPTELEDFIFNDFTGRRNFVLLKQFEKGLPARKAAEAEHAQKLALRDTAKREREAAHLVKTQNKRR